MTDRRYVPMPDQSGENRECPACGCRHWLTVSDSRGTKTIERQRKCRHCGEMDEVTIKLEGERK